MVKARIATNIKFCLVFDSLQTNQWLNSGVIDSNGISHILRLFIDAGVSVDDISAICLSDVYGKARAQDFKDKVEYCREVFETYAFPVLVPVGAESFTKTVGYKGFTKYIGKVLASELYPNQKVIPLQNPLQAKYDPAILDTIKATIELIKVESEFPEIRAKEKLPVFYQEIDSIAKFRKFIDYFLSDEVKVFAYDTETKYTEPLKEGAEILTIQFSHKPCYSFLIPCRFYKDWTDAEWEEILTGLRKLFADETKVVVGHNIKYDNRWIYHHFGIPVRKKNVYCTMAASFACNENFANGLKENAMELTDVGDWEFALDRFKDDYCKKHKIKKRDFTYDLIPYEILKEYSFVDSDVTLRLYYHYLEELKKENQVEVHAMMMRFIYFFTICEINGWPINVKYCEEYQAELAERIAKLEEELYAHPTIKAAMKIKYANELKKENAKRVNKITELKNFEFKLGSNPNKQMIFFDLLKLPVLKKTKSGGKATDKSVVDEWVVNYPAHADFLLTYREWMNLSKLKSTYIDSFLKNHINGRIHPTYSATTTKTARSACKSPNFQNIPVHSKEGKKVKRAIEAEDGKIILGSDLQACEMRYCAIYSSDPLLIEIFNEGLDIHGKVAKDIFPYIDCPINEVKEKFPFERNEVAKRVGFGSLYGIGKKGLARNINASLVSQLKDGKITREQFDKLKYTDEQAGEILSRFFDVYSGVAQYIKDTHNFAKQNGYSLSLLGRKRRVPAIWSDDEYIQTEAMRQAANAPIQSIGSDALLISACDLLDEIEEKSLNITMLGSCHDALYIEVPEGLKVEAADLMIQHLKKIPLTSSPIRMEACAEWGKAWTDFSEDFGVSAIEPEEELEEEVDSDEE